MNHSKNVTTPGEYKRTYDLRRKQTHKRVHLTMSIEEYKVFEQLSEEIGLSPSKTITHLAKSGADLVPPPIPKSTRDFIRDSIIQIRKAGIVFNQCARHWHTKAYIPQEQKHLFIENCEYLATHFQTFQQWIKGLGYPKHRHDP